MAKNHAPAPKAAATPVVAPEVKEVPAVAEAPVASASEADVTEAEAASEEVVQEAEAEATQDEPQAEEAQPEAAAVASDKVPVEVPQAFGLMLTHNHTEFYKAGAYLMPRAHAEHWYAKAAGVKIIE